MQAIAGKKIILGVTGSIAAYKAVFLTRLRVKAGAEVQVLMTPAAARFVQPLTFATLSKRPVYTDVTAEDAWNNPYEYISPGVEGPFDLLSLGADGAEGGEGSDADINWRDVQ